MGVFLTLVLATIITLGLLFVSPILIGQASEAQTQASQGSVSKRIPNSYIITFDEDTPENFIETQAQIVNDTIAPQGGNVTQVYQHALKGVAVENVANPNVLVNASNASAINTIEPNYADVLQTQYIPTGINRVDADRSAGIAKPNSREDRPNIDIAVIDTGTQHNHPDLNTFRQATFLPAANRGPGYDAHGTHTAGTVAAKDNLAGVVGVVPGARIWSLQICDANPATVTESCPRDATLAAWDYVTANAASIEIATMSVGCGPADSAACAVSSAAQTAGTNMVNAGVTLFVSAGNDAVNADDSMYCGVTAAICVSAMTDTDGKCGGQGTRFNAENPDDSRASFSNYGSDVDIMAPGVNILSTFPGDANSQSQAAISAQNNNPYIGASEQGRYGYASGTSMAAPLAAGVGALIKLQNPSFTPAQVKSSMQSNGYGQTQACDGFGKGGLVRGANSDSSEKMLYAGNY